MDRPTVIILTVGIVAFIGGLGLGLFLGGLGMDSLARHSASPQPQSHLSADAMLPDGEGEDAHLRKHVADVERQLVDLKEHERAAILADRLAFYKTAHVAPQSIGGDLKVTRAMVDFLEMTDSEKKAVEDHLAQIYAQVRNLEQQHIKLVKQTDTSVTYEIAPFPEGKALKDNLATLIQGDLGPDRSELFLDNARWEYDQSFAGFGVGKTDIQVTRTDVSGPPSYTLKEAFADGSGEEGPMGSTLPPRYSGLIQLDPSP